MADEAVGDIEDRIEKNCREELYLRDEIHRPSDRRRDIRKTAVG